MRRSHFFVLVIAGALLASLATVSPAQRIGPGTGLQINCTNVSGWTALMTQRTGLPQPINAQCVEIDTNTLAVQNGELTVIGAPASGCEPGGASGQIIVSDGAMGCTAATPTISGSTITGSLNGNASTATALAANPSDCSATQFANAIAANGNLTCAQPAFSDLSGTASGSQLPNPGASTRGGVEAETCSAGDFVSAVNTNGTVTCGTPSGGSGLVLLEQHTASASASLAFTTCITGTYDHYLLSIEDLRTTTGDEQYVIEVSLDGGSTWETTNYSIVLRFLRTTTGSSGNVFYTTAIGLGGDVVGMSGKLEFWKPSATTNRKRWVGTIIVDNAVGGGETYLQDVGGDYRGTSAFNAFRIRILGSSIATGTAYCYGYEK